MSSTIEKTVTDLLSQAGIEINGSQPHDIQIHDNRFFARVLKDGELGLGESYMDGWWDCDQLDEMIHRILVAKLEHKVRKSPKLALIALRAKLFNRQARSRAYQVGEHHYDLGNDLYTAMLDKRLNYTCGYWRNGPTLEKAQEDKLDLVCRKLNLKPGMHVLDLGCGWGGFAIYAAEKYGVKVDGVTVSRQQVALGQKMAGDLPVKLELKDYRDVEGLYDRVLSIGIMEHVGPKNYRTYMETVDRCLKEDGYGFIHTISSNISTTYVNPWVEKYIFPNGMLPSMAQMSKAMEGLFIIEDVQNIGPDYDPTLMAWAKNFDAAWPDLKETYGDRFYRMWRFYLLSAAGGFRSRYNQLFQIVFNRDRHKQPDCRVI
jgi:cyclopropane-fatty-acyl-phospholipid synthase